MRALLPVLVLSLVAPSAAALPTPGLFCDASDVTLGRVFPEPEMSNDFISYDEARCGLDLLLAENPDWMKLDVVGQSVGWSTLPSGHETFDVFVVRVSNYQSSLPTEDKLRVVFQLSIHGNEKGGREGGLRVIEDLVRNVGFVADHPEMREELDLLELLFVFPNPDGWTHEELDYRHNDACYTSETCQLGLTTTGEPGVERQNYVRYNGHGVDVNREWPTSGWVREPYTPLSEPEAQGLVEYLRRETNVAYASDLHGMLAPADGDAQGVECANTLLFAPAAFDPTCFQYAVDGSAGHFVLTMLPAGRQDAREMELTTRLAQLVKERLNGDDFFTEWQALPESPTGWWGGEFNDWGTVWDTLGYTDSGFTSDWYAQDQGLNAPGVDFEFSYNHVYFDNYYPGLAQRINGYHVHATRLIVQAFMERAVSDIAFGIDSGGSRTGYVPSGIAVENEAFPALSGWAQENAADDAYDLGHRPIRASADDYFLDLAGHVPDGALVALDGVDTRALRDLDHVIVPGGAYAKLGAAEVSALRAYAEDGGTLILTDDALQMLPALGLAKPGSVDVNRTYAGHTNFVDRDHPLVANVRGLARETYEPVPLGYNLSAKDAPVWYVERDGLAAGVEIVGVAGEGQGAAANDAWVNLGVAKVGEGQVYFLGALLPTPRAGEDVFYGLDSYATTYTGNELLRTMLGWTIASEARAVTPDSLTAAAAADGANAPVPAPALGVLLLALVAIARLRRR